MTVLGVDVIEAAIGRFADAAEPLRAWLRVAEQAAWQSIHDVRRQFPNSDGGPVRKGKRVAAVATVFNIGGNKYRLITAVSFAAQIVRVRWFLTHAEYDKEKWKKRL